MVLTHDPESRHRGALQRLTMYPEASHLMALKPLLRKAVVER